MSEGQVGEGTFMQVGLWGGVARHRCREGKKKKGLCMGWFMLVGVHENKKTYNWPKENKWVLGHLNGLANKNKTKTKHK